MKASLTGKKERKKGTMILQETGITDILNTLHRHTTSINKMKIKT